MAIQMRRGNEADLDISQLRPGELAVCLDTSKMIVKLSGDNYLTLTDTSLLETKVDSIGTDILFSTSTLISVGNSVTINGNKQLADYSTLEVIYGQFQSGSSISWGSARSVRLTSNNGFVMTKMPLICYGYSNGELVNTLYVFEPSVENNTIVCTSGDGNGVRILRVIGYKQ